MRAIDIRALPVAGLAVVGLAGIAGCGGHDAAAPDTPTPAGGPSSTEKPGASSSVTVPDKSSAPAPPTAATGVPKGAAQVPAAQVDASALPSYYQHRGEVWVYDGGYSLRTYAMATSGCTDAEAVVVDQSAAAVRIMLRPLPQPQGGRPDGQMCTESLQPRPVTVKLTAPLGDRTIHLAAGR